jgi:hypothetical protein
VSRKPRPRPEPWIERRIEYLERGGRHDEAAREAAEYRREQQQQQQQQRRKPRP